MDTMYVAIFNKNYHIEWPECNAKILFARIKIRIMLNVSYIWLEIKDVLLKKNY